MLYILASLLWLTISANSFAVREYIVTVTVFFFTVPEVSNAYPFAKIYYGGKLEGEVTSTLYRKRKRSLKGLTVPAFRDPLLLVIYIQHIIRADSKNIHSLWRFENSDTTSLCTNLSFHATTPSHQVVRNFKIIYIKIFCATF